jgi:heme-degrading monooxygenase HmoA
MMKLTRRHPFLVALSLACPAALAVAASGCTVARPFSRPGPGPAAAIPEGGRSTVTVVLTHAALEGSKRGPFDEYTRRVVDALESGTVAGLVGFSVRREIFGDQVWTMSVWADREASRTFAASSPHREAMERASDAIRSLRVVSFEVPPSAVPPSWEDALRRLDRPEAEVGGAT